MKGKKRRTIYMSTILSIGSTATDKTSLQSSLSIAGLASGMNWATIVTELATVERAPETQWENQETTINDELAAYSTITTDLTTLQLDAETLMDKSFFNTVSASSSDSSVVTASASSGAPTGTYTFDISQLATESTLKGTTLVAAALDASGDASSVTIGSAPFATSVTAGTFTVDGDQVTIATTDSLETVFEAIATATSNKVSASYDASTDKITLSSSSAITLGSSADTSNFLSVAQLYNDNGGSTANTGTVTSTSALGHVDISATMSSANLTTAITGDSSGSGKFSINGVSFTYDLNTDTIQDVLNNINESAAGVSAAYDSNENRFVLTNTSTGNTGISVADVTGNFLTATGLSSGTLSEGKNLIYTLNGNSQEIESTSNTIDDTSSGITNLSVTAVAAGTATVTVATDTSTISTAIQQYVSDYNTLQKYIAGEQAISTATDGTVTPGTLTGDSDTTEVSESLRSLMNSVEDVTGSSGAVTQLADLGFESNGDDNTISLTDSSKLTSMLEEHLSDVAALFSDSTSGLATQLNTYVYNTISSDGSLPTRTADLTGQETSIETQISNLETKIGNDTTEWDSEFSAMETAESQANSELTYISQEVSSGSL
jgi:flagellar hook-associated protein 2